MDEGNKLLDENRRMAGKMKVGYAFKVMVLPYLIIGAGIITSVILFYIDRKNCTATRDFFTGRVRHDPCFWNSAATIPIVWVLVLFSIKAVRGRYGKAYKPPYIRNKLAGEDQQLTRHYKKKKPHE